MFLIRFVGVRCTWWNIHKNETLWLRNSTFRIRSIAGAANTVCVFSASECTQQDCEAFSRQSCGQFYILVIICIRPSGFRPAPRVALKIPKPWNAQSSYQAKPLRMCLSVSLCASPLCHHHPSTAQKKCVFMHAWWWCLWALMCTHQSAFLGMLQPSCRQMETSGTTLGVSPYWSTLPPPPIFPSCLSPPPHPLALIKQKEKLQSNTGRPQNLATGSGSLRLLLHRDKSRPAFDTITQTERRRKHRCNIHIKLQCRQQCDMALRNMLALRGILSQVLRVYSYSWNVIFIKSML